MRKVSLTTVAVLVLGAFILGAFASSSVDFPFGSDRAAADSLLGTDDSDEMLEIFERSIEIMSERSLIEVDRDALMRGAIRGALSMLGDPYADFIGKDAFSNMMDQYYQPTYAGIGVRVTAAPDGAQILEVFRHGPAHIAGLQPGDIIVEVDGENVEELPLSDLVDLIRGEVGTEVTLSVLRDGEFVSGLTMEREEILQPTLDFDLLHVHGARLGYITIREFSDTTPREMERALDGLDEVDGLVIDVRGNPGGVLQSAVNTAAQLVPPGVILETHGRDDVLATFENDSPGVDVPMTVIIDGGTASGAEILAGVVRERGGAILVGANSYGKGMVQSIYDIGGNGLRLTTAEYLLPSGYAIAGRGLDPDMWISRTGTVEPSPRFATFERALSTGSDGPDVESLKSRLQSLGYYRSEVDDEYDRLTMRAVLEFQRDHGLPMTGGADMQTLERVSEMTGLVDSPLNYGELEDHEIEVDNPVFRIDRQMLSALRIHLGQLGHRHPGSESEAAAD